MAGDGLFDRDVEVGQLGELIVGARRGVGGVMTIEGEAGIGKTSLLDFAADEARLVGLRVLRARGSDLEQGFAFGVVRQLLEREAIDDPGLFSGRAVLAASVLESGLDTPRPASEGALHGLYWMVAQLTERAPLLMAIDDLHWADQESVSFLRFLTVRISGMPLAVLLATRPPNAGAPAAALQADPAIELVKPGPLTVTGTSRLLMARLAKEPAKEFSVACHAQTGGNPFLLGQLAQTVLDNGMDPRTRAAATNVAELKADGIARALLARLAGDEVRVARSIAILGDDVAVSTAAVLAGMERFAAERAADGLADAGLLRRGRPLRFRHPLLRSAVLSEMPAGQRAEAHTAAVRLLREHGASAEKVAAHLLAIEPTGSTADAETLIQAGRVAAGRTGPASAETMLTRALQEPPSPAQQFEALMLLGAAENDLGRPDAADRFMEAMGVAVGSTEQAEAAIAAAEAAALDPARAARAVQLLESLPPQDPSSEVGIRVLTARLSATYTDLDRFQTVIADAQLPDRLDGSTAHESLLLAHLTRARLEGGANAGEVADLAQRAARTPVPDDPAWFVMVVIALAATDHHDAAERIAQLAVERAQERGALPNYAFAMTWRARVSFLKGQLRDAEELADAAMQATSTSEGWWRLVPTTVVLETLIDQGRISDAATVWGATGLGETVPPHRPLTPLLQARGRLRIATHDYEKGLADLAESRRRLGRSGAGINGVTQLLYAAEAQWARGQSDEARESATSAVEITQRFGAASSLGIALRIQARLTDDERLARESVALLERTPRRLEHARSLVDLGALLRKHGDRKASREPLRRGHDLAVSCGALDLATRAGNELAASGSRIPRRDPRRRDQLTPSEHRIATMAAHGNTNREIAQSLFLTVKTVEMHLSNAYRKLGVRSRHDLPTALAATPTTATPHNTVGPDTAPDVTP